MIVGGGRLIYTTLKKFDYENHKTKNYIEGDAADTPLVTSLIAALNTLFNLLPPIVVQIIIVIFSLGLCAFGGFKVSHYIQIIHTIKLFKICESLSKACESL